MATQFRILGPVEALVDRRPATLGAPKQRALLALLLVNRRRVVPAEQLIDGLWGEEPPASALQSLQVYVHGLRRALGSERIETAGRGYRAVVTEEELDLDRFERTLERGRAALEAGRAEDAADDLREEWFAGAETVGITAGTSTPDAVIEPVENWLQRTFNRRELAMAGP